MMNDRLEPGDVILVSFPEHVPPGREQHGFRPAIIVGLPEEVDRPRFPVALVVPLTTDQRQPWAVRSPGLYPRIPAPSGGIPVDSIALLDQVRSVGVGRVIRYFGSLEPDRFAALRTGLQDLFRLPARPPS